MIKTDTRAIIGGTIAILLFGMVSSVILGSQTSNLQSLELPNFAGSWACTTEAEICPDGSAVGRVPPYCQFAICPN